MKGNLLFSDNDFIAILRKKREEINFHEIFSDPLANIIIYNARRCKKVIMKKLKHRAEH